MVKMFPMMNNDKEKLKPLINHSSVFVCTRCDCNAYSFDDYELWIKNNKLCGKCYETTTGKLRHYR